MSRQWVIGFHGRSRSGKSTAALFAQEAGNAGAVLPQILNFADEIKEIAAYVLQLPGTVLWGPSETREVILTPTNFPINQDFLHSRLRTVLPRMLNKTPDDHLYQVDALYSILVEMTSRPFTPREALCAIGDFGRSMRPTMWIDKWDTNRKTYGKVIVADVRLPEEVERIRAAGGVVIGISRAAAQRKAAHKTETAIEESGIQLDAHIVNDGTVEQLKSWVIAAVEAYNLRSF